MKTWNDLTEQEKIKMSQLIATFMDIMNISSLDPVGDVFKDVYFGVVKESLDRTTKKVLEESK